MYFLYGSPKTLGIPFSNQKIISIKSSKNGEYISIITESSLILFSGGHERLIVGYFTRSVESVTHDGANEEIYWRHSGDIMLITCYGVAYFLEIKKDDNEESDILDYKFDEETYYVKLESVKPLTINLLGTFRLSNTGVAFFYESDDKMITCSRDGYIQRWKKDKNQFMLEEEISICSLEQEIVHIDTHKISDTFMSSPRKSVNRELKDIDKVETKKLMHENLYISNMSYCPELSKFGICLKNGCCFMMFGDIYSSLKNMKIHLLPFKDTTTISLNYKRRLIAIGKAEGDVLLINDSHNYQIERIISLNPWGINSDVTGQVRNLKWSPDNNVIAVSYDCPGFSVWSTYGCRLNCTINQRHSFKGENENDSLLKVDSCIEWGREGYHLLISSYVNNVSHLKQYSFVKSCIAANINLNYCHRILLQGDNYLLHLYNTFEESGELRWKQIWYPTIYLKDNWPITYVSLSKDGNSIAVSGKRGFCIYNIPTSKWTIFGDVNEERSLICCGLCWYKDSIIITNHDISSNQYEIIFFPKSRLSFSYIQCREVIPKNRKPHYLDCNESTLILFTTDSFFYQFNIDSSGENEKMKFHLQLTQQISIERERHNPQSILLLPYNVNVSSEYDSNKTNLLLLDNSGALTLCNADKSVDIPIAHSVEQFWLANYELEYLGNTMWAYGESGLEVWFPFFSSPSNELQSFSFLSRGRSLEFDLEVYPIGFLPHEAIIVGLCQYAKYSHIHNTTIYDLKTTTEPFLHSVLMRMIRNGKIDESLLMAQKYSLIPHFRHSLELLLHEALEEYFNSSSIIKLDINNKERNHKENIKEESDQQKLERFSTIVNFIKSFGMSIFSEAVVFCARKTDPNMWDILFHPDKGAGSPRYLFEYCINNDNVLIASSYLRVLQIMEDDEYTKEAGLKCLDLCIKLKNRELFDDLMRFFVSREIEPSNLSRYENQIIENCKFEQHDDIDEIIIENFL